MTDKKVLVVVDGYNLFYSTCNILEKELDNSRKYLWYDLFKLVNRHLYEGETIHRLRYFSAPYAGERQKDQREVQDAYAAYHARTYGEKFEKRYGWFSSGSSKKTEEKQTDVNIAISMVTCPYTDAFIRKIVLVSADRDFEPAVEFIRERELPVDLLRLLPPCMPGAKTDNYKCATAQITANDIKESCFSSEVPVETPQIKIPNMLRPSP